MAVLAGGGCCSSCRALDIFGVIGGSVSRCDVLLAEVCPDSLASPLLDDAASESLFFPREGMQMGSLHSFIQVERCLNTDAVCAV